MAAPARYAAPAGFMTQSEVALRLGVAKSTVRRMSEDGRLASYRDNRDSRIRLFKVEDVEKMTGVVPERGSNA